MWISGEPRIGGGVVNRSTDLELESIDSLSSQSNSGHSSFPQPNHPQHAARGEALGRFGRSRWSGTIRGCRLWSFGQGLRSHGHDLGSRTRGRKLRLQEGNGVAMVERPPCLNRLRSLHNLRKWNVHLTRSVTVQRYTGTSPGVAGWPG